MRGRGCNYCQLTGYRGRIGVYELLEMDAGLTDAMRREDLSHVRRAGGKETLRSTGELRAGLRIPGLTSLEEVLRVAGGVGCG